MEDGPMEKTGTYVVAESDVQTHWSGTKYVLDDAMATAENSRGRVSVVSCASASVIVDA